LLPRGRKPRLLTIVLVRVVLESATWCDDDEDEIDGLRTMAAAPSNG
jgi:hypothetical protein